MQNKEIQNNRPIIIFGFAILFLFFLSFLPGEIKIGPFYLKPIDLFMDVKPDSLLSQNRKLKQLAIPDNTLMFASIMKWNNADNRMREIEYKGVTIRRRQKIKSLFIRIT